MNETTPRGPAADGTAAAAGPSEGIMSARTEIFVVAPGPFPRPGSAALPNFYATGPGIVV